MLIRSPLRAMQKVSMCLFSPQDKNTHRIQDVYLHPRDPNALIKGSLSYKGSYKG